MKLSPSRIATLRMCPRLYSWRYEAHKGKRGRLKHYMVSGSMFHALGEAHDLGLPIDDEQAAALNAVVGGPKHLHYGLDKVAHEIRTSPTYNVYDSPIVDNAKKETLKDLLPRYLKWAREHSDNWQIVTVEQPYVSKWWDHITLTVIPDAVVRRDDGLWVMERKLTERDESAWSKKWSLNFQTTAECIAVEAVMGEPVEGVILQHVVVTRKRNKSHSGILPQQISKVIFNEPRCVPKSAFVKAEGKLYIKQAYDEIRWRRRLNRLWEPNYNSCPTCEMQDICVGRTDQSTLVDIPPRG